MGASFKIDQQVELSTHLHTPSHLQQTQAEVQEAHAAECEAQIVPVFVVLS